MTASVKAIRTIKARCVVNATGVWVDALRNQALGAAPGATPSRMVSPSQGVHVVVDRDFMPGHHALLVPKTRDGRVLFAVPWMGKLILGTTDTPRQDLPREPTGLRRRAGIHPQRSRAGPDAARCAPKTSAASGWACARWSRHRSKRAAAPKPFRREHTIVVDGGNVVTVTGGKWTTYRAMAEDVLDRCFDEGLLPRRAGQHHRPPPPGGCTCRCYACHARLCRSGPAPLWHRGAMKYSRAPAPGAHLGMGLTEAMVRYAVRHEYAETVEDVLARRWRALFLDARQAASHGACRRSLAAGRARPGPCSGRISWTCAPTTCRRRRAVSKKAQMAVDSP